MIRTAERLTRAPLHPLLLAAYPILFLYAANLEEVLPIDVVQPLAWALGAAVVLLVALGLVFRSVMRAGIIVSALMVAWFFFGHAAPALTDLGLNEELQLVAWGLLLAVAIALAIRAGQPLIRVTEAANLVSIVLVALTLATIVPYEVARATREARAASTDPTLPVATRNPGRDILYLVFDRYGSDWSIRQRFGIDNGAMTRWLADRGFEVVPGARANYRATDFSIAATLTMDFLDHITERYGRNTGDRTPARQLIQDHAVGKFLQANGYRYVHIASWYDPTLDNAIADEVLRYDQTTELSQVLHDTSLAPVIERPFRRESNEPPHRVRQREFAQFQFRQVVRAPSSPTPVFVFAHITLPHPPYTYRADGSAMLNEEEKSLPEEVLYREQLAYTNTRIRETVNALLSGPPEEHPIIVIQADEGPFICFNVDCIDGSPEALGIRFGILGAYYFPGLDDDVLPPDHSSVNTFRTIFREYFGADFPPLPNRSFNWPDNDHIYDFRDITDQLPLPTSDP